MPPLLFEQRANLVGATTGLLSHRSRHTGFFFFCPRGKYAGYVGLCWIWLVVGLPASIHWHKRSGRSRCRISQSREAQLDTATALSDIHLRDTHPTRGHHLPHTCNGEDDPSLWRSTDCSLNSPMPLSPASSTPLFCALLNRQRKYFYAQGYSGLGKDLWFGSEGVCGVGQAACFQCLWSLS